MLFDRQPNLLSLNLEIFVKWWLAIGS